MVPKSKKELTEGQGDFKETQKPTQKFPPRAKSRII